MIRTAISTLTLIVATPALAQVAAATSDQAAGHDIVVTASRVTQDAREIGGAVSVVTAADLKQGQIGFAKDVLQDLPGVRISSDRPGDLTSVSIRGSNNDEVLWLIDGIALGDPSAITTAFQPDHLTSRDIARIEVLRGNQSSLYGADAIGGVINVITQRATQDGLHVNAEGEGGSYGTASGGASLLGRTGALDFRLTGTGDRHSGPSLADPRTADPAGSVREDDEYWRYGASGRAGLRATPTLAFETTGFWDKSLSDLDFTTSDSADTVRKREYAAAVKASYAGTDRPFKVDLTASRYQARRLYFGAYNLPDGDIYRGTKDELDLAASYGGTGPISLAAGGNLERERSYTATAFSDPLSARDHTRAVYGEVALRPLTGMTLTGAGRIDDNSRFGAFRTYRGTFAYAVGGVKLRASYGTGAKAPGLYQLFDPTYGNPALKEETSRGGDAGIDIAILPGMTAQLTYFFNAKRDEINFDGGAPPYGRYGQFGRTRARGVEVAATARPLPWLALSQSYTYVDHRVDLQDGAGWVDSGRPKYTGTSEVTLTPIGEASLTARVRYHDGDASGYGGVTSPYTIVDLLGSFALTDRVELYGRVRNLADRFYQVTYGTNALGRSVYGGVRVSY